MITHDRFNWYYPVLSQKLYRVNNENLNFGITLRSLNRYLALSIRICHDPSWYYKTCNKFRTSTIKQETMTQTDWAGCLCKNKWHKRVRRFKCCFSGARQVHRRRLLPLPFYPTWPNKLDLRPFTVQPGLRIWRQLHSAFARNLGIRGEKTFQG